MKIIMRVALVIIAVILTMFIITACGNEPFNPIPNVMGMDYNDAIALLEDAGFRVNAVSADAGTILASTQHDRTVLQGQVFRVNDELNPSYRDIEDFPIAPDGSVVITYALSDHILLEWTSMTFYGLTFEAPSHWIVKERDYTLELEHYANIAIEPPDSDFEEIYRGRLRIQVFDNGPWVDFDMFLEFEISEFVEYLIGLYIDEIIDSGNFVGVDFRDYELRMIAGHYAIRFDYTLRSLDDDWSLRRVKSKFVAYVDIDNHDFYVYFVLIAITKDSPDYMEDVFDRVISSISFDGTFEPDPDSVTDPTPTPEPATTDWREFLRLYEAWVDDYIDLLERYHANPTDPGLLAAYLENVQLAVEWAQQAEQIQGELSGDDLTEYIATVTRIAQRLAEAAIALSP